MDCSLARKQHRKTNWQLTNSLSWSSLEFELWIYIIKGDHFLSTNLASSKPYRSLKTRKEPTWNWNEFQAASSFEFGTKVIQDIWLLFLKKLVSNRSKLFDKRDWWSVISKLTDKECVQFSFAELNSSWTSLLSEKDVLHELRSLALVYPRGWHHSY